MITLALADQLDALALKFEAASAPSSTLNTSLLKLVRAPMLEIFGVTLPTSAAQYGSNYLTALKLRIPPEPSGRRWNINVRELWHPSNPPALAGIERADQIGTVNGGTYGMGQTIALAACAAIARSWALRIRLQLAGGG